MKNRVIICFITAATILAPSILFGQDQNWFFGYNAGLDFNTTPPTSITAGQLVSYEGGSGMSDTRGNLLFYSDGIKVWNRNHVQMRNGFGLLGHQSSAQGILIVQDPGDTNKYFIFTIAQLAGSDGMRYSIVDMTLQGGLGDISQKNVFVRNNLTEKITGIVRCDGNVWIVTHEWQSNRFFADLLTPSGLSAPVISSTGVIHTGGGNGIKNTIGHMKISPQGDKLALAIRDMDQFDVFDFDISTGIISNPLSLINSSYSPAYGIEFSQDGTKLYTNNHIGNIYQFDLSYATATAMRNNAYTFTSADMLGSMQRGPDGKIYVARNNGSDSGIPYLGVLNSPNSLGSGANFVDNGISLGTQKSRWGLPNIMTIPSRVELFGDTLICAGDTANLTARSSGNIQWVAGSNSTSPIIQVIPGTTTTYSVVAQNSICIDSVNITVHVEQGGPLNILASDSIICPGDSISLNVAGAGTGLVNWSGGGVNSQQGQIKVAPTVTTKYYVSGGSAKCAGRDSIEITVLSGITAAFTQTPTICGLEVAFQSNTFGADNYLWDFGDGNSGTGPMVVNNYLTSGTYRVRLTVTETKCGFSDTVSLVISVADTTNPPEITLPNISRCQDGTVDFFTDNGNSRYQYGWDFGNGTQSVSRNPTANYQDTGVFQVVLRITDTLCGDVYLDTAIIDLDQLQSEIFIPNCFTPNGDGINELFQISGNQCGEGDVLEIYNRWGSKLYRTEKPYKEFWDGTFKGRQCTESVYYYLLFTSNKVRKGHLSLIR